MNLPGEVATVTATYVSTSGAISDDVDVICADNLYAITVTSSPASPIPGASSTITAYVTVNGAPIADGTPIYFSEVGDGTISSMGDFTTSGSATTVLTLTSSGDSSIVIGTYISPSGAISDSVFVIRQ